MTWPYDCPHVVGADCSIGWSWCLPAMMDRVDDCPADLGPWGAWRSVVAELNEIWLWLQDTDAWGLFAYLMIADDLYDMTTDLLDAVGWKS